jgi:hypothetical protein
VKEALDPPAGPDDEASAIGFGTFLDRVVPQNGIKPLATVLTITDLKRSNVGFQVEAYEHAKDDWNDAARTATNYMSAKVTWSGNPTSSNGTWTYSPIKYWPGEKVSFFAYFPTTGWFGTTFTPATANENPKLYCETQTGYLAQQDFIVDAKYNLTGDADKVTFKFDHVLSRIGFKAKTSYAPATVTMSSLTFYYGGLRRSGTYTFDSGTGNGDDKNNKAGKWEVTNGPSVGNSNNFLASTATLSSITLSSTPYDISEAYNPKRYLMLIPQENPAATADQAYMRVSYTIDYPPDHDPPNEKVSNERVDLPPITWEPGIAYTYTLNIGPREMIFHVSEEIGWGSEVSDDIFHFPP